MAVSIVFFYNALLKEMIRGLLKKEKVPKLLYVVDVFAVTGAAGSIIADGSGDGMTGGKSTGVTPAGLAIGGGIGIVLGGLLGVLVMYFKRRKGDLNK